MQIFLNPKISNFSFFSFIIFLSVLQPYAIPEKLIILPDPLKKTREKRNRSKEANILSISEKMQSEGLTAAL